MKKPLIKWLAALLAVGLLMTAPTAMMEENWLDSDEVVSEQVEAPEEETELELSSDPNAEQAPLDAEDSELDVSEAETFDVSLLDLPGYLLIDDSSYVVRRGYVFRIDLNGWKAVAFHSSDENVAVVMQNGVVSTRQPGKTKIYVYLPQSSRFVLDLTVLSGEPVRPACAQRDPAGAAQEQPVGSA